MSDEFDRLVRIARRREISCSAHKHAVRFRARFDKHPNLENAGLPSWLSCRSDGSICHIRSSRQSSRFILRFAHSPFHPFSDSRFPASILRRLELGEFFLRVGYVGFVRAAELKQSLLTPQIRFGEFKLGGLAFCYCFLLGFD
jgi:hypothetical protein